MSHSLPPTRQPLSQRYKLCWLRWLPAWCLLPALFHLIPFAFAMLKARIWATLKLYRGGAVSRLGAPWFYGQRHSASRKGIKDAGGLKEGWATVVTDQRHFTGKLKWKIDVVCICVRDNGAAEGVAAASAPSSSPRQGSANKFPFAKKNHINFSCLTCSNYRSTSRVLHAA